MKKNKLKFMLIILVLVLSFSTCIYATSNESLTETANRFISQGSNSNAGFNTTPATEGFQDLAGLLLGIGVFIAVAVGIILGIKFMISTAEQKAEISKLLTPYIVGVVLIVGALTIWKVAIEILTF